MTRILLTGATGNVGAATLRALQPYRSAGTTLVAAARDAAQARRQLGAAEGLEFVALDFENSATWPAALMGGQRLLLVRPPQLSDVQRHLFPFLDAAQVAWVQHVVFLSLQGAQFNVFAPHHKVEKYLQRSGLGYSLLRPSFFMQNLSTTHRNDIRRRHELLLPAGQGRTSFVDVRDVGTVAAQLLLAPHLESRAYELTGTEALTYAEVAATLTAVLGRPIRYRAASVRQFKAAQRAQGTPAEFANVMTGIYLVARLGLAARVTPELARLLGRPPLTFRQFAQDYRACWEDGVTSVPSGTRHA